MLSPGQQGSLQTSIKTKVFWPQQNILVSIWKRGVCQTLSGFVGSFLFLKRVNKFGLKCHIVEAIKMEYEWESGVERADLRNLCCFGILLNLMASFVRIRSQGCF